MIAILNRAAGAALDLLFPPRCAVCHREGSFLHDSCRDSLPRLEAPYCSLCAAPGAATLCRWCEATPPSYDGVRAPYRMDGAVKDMVYDLKYRNVRATAPDLGRLLEAFMQSHPLPGDVLVPVPLHKRRERERGYNQSALLARALPKTGGIPVETDVLRRVRNTPPQVSLEGHEERIHNLEGAFLCGPGLEGKDVLLIDDVVTTGSTMSACAAALKDAGASSVWGMALARQG